MLGSPKLTEGLKTDIRYRSCDGILLNGILPTQDFYWIMCWEETWQLNKKGFLKEASKQESTTKADADPSTNLEENGNEEARHQQSCRVYLQHPCRRCHDMAAVCFVLFDVFLFVLLWLFEDFLFCSGFVFLYQICVSYIICGAFDMAIVEEIQMFLSALSSLGELLIQKQL